MTAAVRVVIAPLATAAVDRRLARGESRVRERAVVAGVVCATSAFCCHALPELGLVPLAARRPLFAVLRVIYACGFGPALPILDAHTVAMLGGDRTRYGEERLYGTVSWALINVALGFAIDLVGSWIMYLGAVASTAALVAVIGPCRDGDRCDGTSDVVTTAEGDHVNDRGSNTIAPVATGTKEQMSEPPRESVSVNGSGFDTGWSLALSFARNPSSCGFLVALACVGVGMSLVENMLFLLFVQDMGSSKGLCGISVAVTVMFEIPIFAMSNGLLKRFGVSNLFCLGLLCYIVRAYGYTLCSSGLCVLAFEPLHGVIIACAGTSSVEYVASITPPRLQTTAQGLRSAVHGGFGGFIGALFGGMIIDAYGEVVLYRGASALVCLGLATFLAGKVIGSSSDKASRRCCSGASFATTSALAKETEEGVPFVALRAA
eukprot:TRINITY_DN9024_c1_g1_i1.p1 TRINITY_DN9024_c1_g1~~TRINITY_DN9024_c1_g1_i1.p1  ORF type:complete len:489 (-),score=45.64 TRINITY_DN9024_c1_g1_i1:140-1438(-)